MSYRRQGGEPRGAGQGTGRRGQRPQGGRAPLTSDPAPPALFTLSPSSRCCQCRIAGLASSEVSKSRLLRPARHPEAPSPSRTHHLVPRSRLPSQAPPAPPYPGLPAVLLPPPPLPASSTGPQVRTTSKFLGQRRPPAAGSGGEARSRSAPRLMSQVCPDPRGTARRAMTAREARPRPPAPLVPATPPPGLPPSPRERWDSPRRSGNLESPLESRSCCTLDSTICKRILVRNPRSL